MQSPRSKLYRLLPSLMISVSTIATAISAQEVDNKPIEEFIVSAARTAKPVTAIPNMVTIINSDDLNAQLTVSTDTAGLLANLVPSFSPSRQKLSGLGESFRGRSPLYLIDGIPQSNPLRDSSRDGHSIDLALVERIEVIHGANAIQGMGATGGIINFVTKKPSDDGELTLGVQASITTADNFGDDGFEYKGSLYATQKIGKFDYIASANYHKRGLFFDGENRPIAIDAIQGDLAESRERDFFVKLGFEPDENQRFQLTINDYLIKGDDDYGTLNGDRANGIPATAILDNFQGLPSTNDVTTISLDYTHKDVAGGTFQAQLFSQDFRAVFGGGIFTTFQDPLIAPIGELYDQSENNSEKLGGRFNWNKDQIAGTSLNLFLGVDLLKDKTFQRLALTDRAWVPETTYENAAPFIQLELPIAETLTISGGLRYEIATLKIDDYTSIAGNRRATDFARTEVAGGSPSFKDLIKNIGVVFEPFDGWTLYSSYSEGFTMPDVGRVLRGINEPNQSVDGLFDLDPIKADNIEFGTSYTGDIITARASVFQSSSDLGARYIAGPDGVFLTVAREKTRIRGFEATLDANFENGFGLGAILSLLSGRVDTDDDKILDADLDAANIGPDKLNLHASYQGDGWSAKLQLAHIMSRDFTDAADAVATSFDGYDLVDLFLSKNVGQGAIQLGIQNLFDKQYITYYSQAGTTRNDRYYSGRGRSITLAYKAEF